MLLLSECKIDLILWKIVHKSVTKKQINYPTIKFQIIMYIRSLLFWLGSFCFPEIQEEKYLVVNRSRKFGGEWFI